MQMDRIIITLAGGALILSVAFLADIAPSPKWRWILIVSWALLLGAVAAIAVSYWTADRSLLRSVENIDEWMNDPDRGSSVPESGKTPHTRRLSTTGLLLFVLGLVMLGLFAAVNFA